MRRFFESWHPWLFGLIAGAAAGHWAPSDLAMGDLLNAVLGVGAIAIGFLATAMTTLLALRQEKSSVFRALSANGHFDRLLRFLVTAIRLAFVLSVLCAVGLFLKGNVSIANHRYGPLAARIAVGLWAGVLVATGFACYRIIELFMKALRIHRPPVSMPVLEEDDASKSSGS